MKGPVKSKLIQPQKCVLPAIKKLIIPKVKKDLAGETNSSFSRCLSKATMEGAAKQATDTGGALINDTQKKVHHTFYRMKLPS